MKRAQRRTNFKKIRAAAQNVDHVEHRQTRSNKTATAGLSARENIDTASIRPELASEAKQESPFGKRANLTRFLYKEKRLIPPEVFKSKENDSSDDFETPVKKTKTAPKLCEQSQPADVVKPKRKRSKQPKIKGALLKTEEVFSEIAAQHCIADNFNPDDIQMALMISRSEMDMGMDGNSHAANAALDGLHAGDVNKETDQGNNDDIRAKLQQDGFRTAARADYTNCIAAAFAVGQRRGRTKWANKFTALTLRDPEKQAKKLAGKIEAMLAHQNFMEMKLKVHTKFNTASKVPYKIRSDFLRGHVASNPYVQFFHTMESLLITGENLNKFFIEELFPVSYLPAGYLLKDWTLIPGRDKSPQRLCPKRLTDYERKFERFYEELEGNDRHSTPHVPTVADAVPLVAMESNCGSDNELNALIEDIAQQTENAAPSLSTSIKSMDSFSCNNCDSFGTNTQTRCASPDLFADSDSDSGEFAESNNANNITIFENFSSDEVKTALHGENGKEELLSMKANTDNMNQNQIALCNGMVEGELCNPVQEATENKEVAENDVEIISNCANSNAAVTESFSGESNEVESLKVHTDAANLVFDLTQSDEDDAKDDDEDDMGEIDDCIILSDDEINYSILKANDQVNDFDLQSSQNSDSSQCNHQSPTNENVHNFSVLEFFKDDFSLGNVNVKTNDASICRKPSFDLNLSNDAEPIQAQYLSVLINDDEVQLPEVASVAEQTDVAVFSMPNEVTMTSERPTDDASVLLKAQRAEFGILESQSEPFSQTPPHWERTPIKFDTPNRSLATRSSEKFSSFLYNNVDLDLQPPDEFEDFDDFDRLVYGSPPPKHLENTKKPIEDGVPAGLSQLLTGEISFEATVPTTHSNHATPKKQLKEMEKPVEHEEITIDDRIYVVRTLKTSKPNFEEQSEAEILKQLYDFGIKLLKRKQAIKILEYIYTETHPIITEPATNPTADSQTSLKVQTSQSQPQSPKSNKFKSFVKKLHLVDCPGHLLLRYSQELNAELSDKEESYIFQTNITKKTQRPLLPLHIAWFNMVCANQSLHESILMYEPIDLLEVSVFLRSLGYRYEPKDIKSFFDRRCIIFRYDLTPPDKQKNRYIRKPK